MVTAGTLSITPNGQITTDTFGPGNGGSIAVSVAGPLSIDGTSSTVPTGITALTGSSGNAGNVTVAAGSLNITRDGLISVDTLGGSGSAGSVTVNVAGAVSIDGTGQSLGTGISSESGFSTGNAGEVRVSAGSLMLSNGGQISASTFGAGAGGDVQVSAGVLALSSGGEISASTFADGPGGNVRVTGNSLTIAQDGSVSASTFGKGAGGGVTVGIAGPISIDGTGQTFATGITSASGLGGGNAGQVNIGAGSLAIVNGGEVSTSTRSKGNGGDIMVNLAGDLVIDGSGNASTSSPAGIIARTLDANGGNAGRSPKRRQCVDPRQRYRLDLHFWCGRRRRSNGKRLGKAGHRWDQYAEFRDGNSASSANFGAGNAGRVTVSTGDLAISHNGEIQSLTFELGNGGDVTVNAQGRVSIDGSGAQLPTGLLTNAQPGSSGRAGAVALTGQDILISGGGLVSSGTAGQGDGGTVRVAARGSLSLSGAGTGVIASASSTASGNAGSVTVGASQIAVTGGAEISSTTAGTGAGGSVDVTTPGALVLDGAGISGTQIAASATGPQSGPGGSVMVAADNLTVQGGARIAATTTGPGKGGDVAVMVANEVNLSGTGPDGASGITASAEPGSSGAAGEVVLTAGGAIALADGARVVSSTAGAGDGGTIRVTAQAPLSLTGADTGIIASATLTASGNAGSVLMNAPQITLLSGAQISSTTEGTGTGGSVGVTTPGALVLDGAGMSGTQIAASATGPQSGPGGSVAVSADTLTIEGGARIAASTAGLGKGGDVAVVVANEVNLSGTGPDGASGITAAAELGSIGQAGEIVLAAGGAIALTGGARVVSSTAGAGGGGTIRVTAQAPLSLSGADTGIIASATSTASGNAGSVLVNAPQIALLSGAQISSTTAGTGAGGSVGVTTPGALALDGAGVSGTQIAASAIGPQSGPGGSVTVGADTLTVEGGARIAATTAGPGKGGDLAVTVANGVNLSGTGPDGASGITASAEPGSSGQAGEVVLMAGGAITVSDGARVTSSTAGNGDAGTVRVSSQGPLNLTGPGSEILVAATSTASGNAGSVMVAAPQIALLSGAEISSTTAGTGAGGSVNVTTPGRLVLDGAGIAGTQIAASATGPHSGPGGSVTVAADALTIEGGAHIASTTFGSGKAGDIGVTVVHNAILSGSGADGASGITASAEQGSSGGAGEVILVAGGAVALADGARVTFEHRRGGCGRDGAGDRRRAARVNRPGTGIIASATSTASGDAGAVTVAAPQITITTGAEISSTTAGTGAGGSVMVTTPGALALNGGGDENTQIAASAIGLQSGSGGSVTVSAGSLDCAGWRSDRQLYRRSRQGRRRRCHGRFGHRAAGPRAANHGKVDRQWGCGFDHRLGGTPADG